MARTASSVTILESLIRQHTGEPHTSANKSGCSSGQQSVASRLTTERAYATASYVSKQVRMLVWAAECGEQTDDGACVCY